MAGQPVSRPGALAGLSQAACDWIPATLSAFRACPMAHALISNDADGNNLCKAFLARDDNGDL